MNKTKFERYGAYKESGVEWLGEVPSHWIIRRIKDVGSIKYGLGQPPSYLEQGLPFIRATNIERGKIVEKGLVFISPDDIPHERDPILKTNDILVVRSGAYTADSAIVPKIYEGAIAGYDMVITPQHVDAKYLAFTLLSNYVLKDQLLLSSFRAAQPHLNKEELGITLFFYPSLQEQTAIAAYLDNKTAQIDRKVELLNQKAAHYAALKQSLINETVTQGLDRSVPMKESGVEWIGKVPRHWHLNRVKNLTNTQSGTTPHSETRNFYEDGTNYWIRTTDLNNGRLWESEYKITNLAVESCGLKFIPVNSVLLAMYGGMGTIGKNAILQVKATINQSVCAVLPNEKYFNSVYFWYYLQYFRPHWEIFANLLPYRTLILKDTEKR